MNKEKNVRRTFLKSILAGSAVIAGVTAVDKKAKAEPGKTSTSPEEQLYTESDHFRKYYKTLL